MRQRPHPFPVSALDRRQSIQHDLFHNAGTAGAGGRYRLLSYERSGSVAARASEPPRSNQADMVRILLFKVITVSNAAARQAAR